MIQITGVGFSSFRVFKTDAFFELSPITIFTGTNNSGKSSIFKGLLLLKNNRDNYLNLDFIGEDHKLGTFENSKNKFSGDSELKFRLRFDKQHATKSTLDTLFFEKFVFEASYKQSLYNAEGGILSECQVFLSDEKKSNFSFKDILFRIECDDNYFLYFNLKYFFEKLQKEIIPVIREEKDNITFHNNGNFSPNEKFQKGFKYLYWFEKLLPLIDYDFSIVSIDELRKISESNSNHYSESQISVLALHLNEILFVKFSAYTVSRDFGSDLSNDAVVINSFSDILNEYKKLITLQVFLFEDISSKKIVELAGLSLDVIYKDFLEGFTVGEIVSKDFIYICKEFVIDEIESLLQSLKNSVGGIKNIEGIRANSQRLYTNQSQGTTFNQLLLEAGQKWSGVSDNNLSKSATYNFVQKWIKKFRIADRININRVKGIATEVYFTKDGEKVDLIDLGYGVTQFLPILLYIALKFNYKLDAYPEQEDNINSNNGPLLLIEEPESNLHPKLQSLLADFFIDVAKNFEVTLLIETHSEYLIRRLQVLTAAGEVSPEDSVIYYLDGNNKSDTEDFVRKININPDGSLTNDFGPGFIDEATNWKMELMRLKNAHLYNTN